MTLVSPHRIDQFDELRKLVSPRSGGEINADALLDARATKDMVAIRQAWMQATGAADEPALRSVISHLRIRDGVSMDDLEFRLDSRLALAGLEPVDRTSAIHKYDALAKAFISARQYQHDRAVLEAHLRREKLYRGLPAPDPDRPEQLGIKSFAPYAYDLEDEASVLNLLRFFHGRGKLAEVGWDTDILPELVAFLTTRVRSGRAYDLHLDTHLSISFAAGEVLAEGADHDRPGPALPDRWARPLGHERGRHHGPRPRGATGDRPRGGPETAFALEVTRLVADDVAMYAKRELPQVGRIVVATIAGGPSPTSVRDGAHAHALAEAIAARVQAERDAEARVAPLHLFASAPGGLTFLLGAPRAALGLRHQLRVRLRRRAGSRSARLPPAAHRANRAHGGERMTAVTTYFDRFLENIRLTKELRDACAKAHNDLRLKLVADTDLNPIFVSMFLQGSYARHTGTKLHGKDTHVDVDQAVVTNLRHQENPPDLVVARFTPFLNREYPDQWERNDRSIKITPTDTPVTLDLVITAAPSEAQTELYKSFRESGVPDLSIEAAGDLDSQESRVFREAIERISKAFGGDWQKDPLMIPSRDLGHWVEDPPARADPLDHRQERAERRPLRECREGHQVVAQAEPEGEYPKAYPLEHFIGDYCPDGIDSVAKGVAEVLESIRATAPPMFFTTGKPRLFDRGVPDNDPFKKITAEQYATFHGLVTRDGPKAKAAFDADTINESAIRWREIFGPEFPEPAPPGFTPPIKPAQPETRGRYG